MSAKGKWEAPESRARGSITVNEYAWFGTSFRSRYLQEQHSIGGTVPVGPWMCLEWEFNDTPDQA